MFKGYKPKFPVHGAIYRAYKLELHLELVGAHSVSTVEVLKGCLKMAVRNLPDFLGAP